MSDNDPTISIGSMLEKQITALERSLTQRLDATDRNVKERFDRQDEELVAIKSQTMRTNGRVTALERARDRAEGVIFAFSWVPVVVASILTSGLTILVMALSGSIR